MVAVSQFGSQGQFCTSLYLYNQISDNGTEFTQASNLSQNSGSLAKNVRTEVRLDINQCSFGATEAVASAKQTVLTLRQKQYLCILFLALRSFFASCRFPDWSPAIYLCKHLNKLIDSCLIKCGYYLKSSIHSAIPQIFVECVCVYSRHINEKIKYSHPCRVYNAIYFRYLLVQQFGKAV